MKKIILILISLFLTTMTHSQIIPQPKPGAAPTIKIGKPQTFKLKNGLKVMVVENHKLPRVSFSLTIDNLPYLEANKKGVADMTSALMGSGTAKISKDAFNEEIDFLGANIDFSANGAYASCLSKFGSRVLELMVEGALYPKFTQIEFDKEKAKIIEGLKSEEKSVSSVSARVNEALTFGINHPSGEFLTEKSLNNVTLEDVQNNFKTYFVPTNAYLIVVGDVKFKQTKAVVEKLFENWKPTPLPTQTYTNPKNVSKSEINFIDMPNAVQSEVAGINLVDLKMTDPDYFATIIANQILGGDFNSYVNMNLREAHGWTYGARSSVGADKYLSKFKVSTQVRNSVTDSTVVEIFKELKRIRTEKVADEMLQNVKAGYVGRFVMQIEKPQTIAAYALRIQTQQLPMDFYENYIQNINAVTADDVLRVANKYFLDQNMRMIIVGKAADVLPGLENLKMPIKYFDRYAQEIEKPETTIELPKDITVKKIIDSYITAIGGIDAVNDVKSISITANGSAQGFEIVYSKLVTSNHKLRETIEVMGQNMKKVFDGEKGYQEQAGQKIPFEEADIASLKAYSIPFPELSLLDSKSVELAGIEVINDKKAYVLKDGKRSFYYDILSGLKIAETEEGEASPGQMLTITIPYDDYRVVNGVKIPFKTAFNIGVEVNLSVTDVKINSVIKDEDFK